MKDELEMDDKMLRAIAEKERMEWYEKTYGGEDVSPVPEMVDVQMDQEDDTQMVYVVLNMVPWGNVSVNEVTIDGKKVKVAMDASHIKPKNGGEWFLCVYPTIEEAQSHHPNSQILAMKARVPTT